jgi:tetratricopeptide (TPR) repeat protein
MLEPNDVDAHFFFSRYLLTTGRLAENKQQLELAARLDPLSLIVASQLAGAYHFEGRDDSAIALVNRTLEVNPNFVPARAGLGLMLAFRGDSANGLAQLREAVRLSGRQPSVLGFLALASGRAGDVQAARALLSDLKSPRDSLGVRDFPIALAYVGLNERDSALVYLQRAAARRDLVMALNLASPYFAPLRDDPRFQRVRTLLKLPGS